VVTAIFIYATQLLGNDFMEASRREEIGAVIAVRMSGPEWYDARRLVRKVFPDDRVIRPWEE
jgi:hypothetical protein